MRNLNEIELEKVNGGWGHIVAGGVAGAIGGFFGAVISGGQNATAWDLAKGALAGGVAGALNPVKGFGTAIANVGAGVASGAAVSVAEDARAALESDE